MYLSLVLPLGKAVACILKGELSLARDRDPEVGQFILQGANLLTRVTTWETTVNRVHLHDGTVVSPSRL